MADTATAVLVIHGRPADGRSEGAADVTSQVSSLGLRLRELTETEENLAVFTAIRSASPTGIPVLVVTDPDVEHPFRCARRILRDLPEVRFLFVVRPDRESSLKREAPFVQRSAFHPGQRHHRSAGEPHDRPRRRSAGCRARHPWDGPDRQGPAGQRRACLDRPDRHRRSDLVVVDDNADAAHTLCALLQALGHRVEAHTDPRGVLELLRGPLPGAMILDIGMPHIDGYELARRIRTANGGDKPTLIALTGYGQSSDRDRAMQAGFDHHLVKPFDFELLNGILERLQVRAERS